MKTINLEEILLSKIPKDCYWEEMNNLTNCPKNYIIEAMEEFGKQLLYLAAENAEIDEFPPIDEDGKVYKNEINIFKPSILDTINQVK